MHTAHTAHFPMVRQNYNPFRNVYGLSRTSLVDPQSQESTFASDVESRKPEPKGKSDTGSGKTPQGSLTRQAERLHRKGQATNSRRRASSRIAPKL
eukprot:g72486.t1